jgi:hypothetical protein
MILADFQSEGEEYEAAQEVGESMAERRALPLLGFFEGEKVQSMGEEEEEDVKDQQQQAVPLASNCRQYFWRFDGSHKSFLGIQDGYCVLKVETQRNRPVLVPLADALDAVFWENKHLRDARRGLSSENMKLRAMLAAVRKATDPFNLKDEPGGKAEGKAVVSADEARPLHSKKRKQKAETSLDQGKKVRKSRKPTFQVRVCKETLNKLKEFVRDQVDTICTDLSAAMDLLPEYEDIYPSTFDAFPEPFATAYKTFRLSGSHFSSFKEWGFPTKMAEIRAKCAAAEGSGEDEEPLAKRPKNQAIEEEE